MNPAATIVVAPGSTSDSPGDPGTLLFENDRVRPLRQNGCRPDRPCI